MTDPILIDKINLALADIRPYLEDDGGDIELIEVTDDFIVKVKFLGACKSCNMSAMTLKGGVEETIKNAIPEIKAVIAVEEILS
ncbi:MAG: NifU family protein [Flavobacteriales bacterium]|jgi:Fe-S cluster biogenesis protein NfuA|tara:strand:- start:2341 stop:2592 length:252 start_codon:yes stop_codon:yes gene_type:complete